MSFTELMNTKIGALSLGDLLSAVLIFVVCVAVIWLLDSLLQRALRKSRMEGALRSFVASCVKVGLWIVACLIVADTLGIPSASLVASLSVVGLALSLSLQSILGNVFSGFTILFTKPFAAGDYVELGSVSGSVTAMGLFYTTLLTPDNKEVHIPNGQVSSGTVVNYSREPNRRIDLTFGLGFDCPAEAVRRTLTDCAAKDERVLSDPAPCVLLSAYKASNVEYILRCWVRTPDYWDAYYAINESARTALEKAGLSMSFDRMDVRILDK